MRIGPVAFLFAVAGGWAAVRAVLLWPETSVPEAPRRIAWQQPLSETPTTSPPARAPQAAVTFAARFVVLPSLVAKAGKATAIAQPAETLAYAVTLGAPAPRIIAKSVVPIHLIEHDEQPSADQSRWSVSGWSILRNGAGKPVLASAGQLGGSQAGARLRYDLGLGLAVAARVSAPLRSSIGKEAAIALDWRPARQLPLTFTIERRAGLDRGGRDAFAAGLFGGVGAVHFPLGARLDGYAQAGVVGIRRRDGYVDGALRVERTIAGSGRLRIGAGAGLWGGAQRHVSRLDVGPQLVAHVPIAGGGVRIGAEWRTRWAGNARPGSGAALTIGADF